MTDHRLLLSLVLEEEAVLLAAIAAAITMNPKKSRTRRKRKVWAREWLLRRPEYGLYERLLSELAREDRIGFRNFHRMDPDMYQEILARVGPRIQKQKTNWREPLSPGLRLAITLRYLATGDSYMSLQYSFRVSNNAISRLIPETCEAIFQEYTDEVLRCPQTPEEWRAVSSVFGTRWNLHNVVGALDGKHVAIRCPRGAGSLYYNYKGFHSIVMLALADADYRFLFLDVGANGR